MPCGTLTAGSSTTVKSLTVKTDCNLVTDECIVTSPNFHHHTHGEKETTGVCTPNYHKRRKAGELLPHTYFSQYEIEGQGRGAYTVNKTSGTPRRVTQANYGFTSNQWVVSQTQLDSEWNSIVGSIDPSYYVQAAAARIYGKGHDTLTFIAEIHKTRAMFKDTLKRLLESMKGKRKFDPWRNSGNDWLQGRYGWRTLLFDLNDLRETLNNLDDQRNRYTERAGTTSSTVETTTTTGSFTSSYYQIVTTDVVEVSVRGSVSADISPANFSFNLARTGWELVPFSFVVDWLYNIGQAIEALSFMTLATNHTASSGLQITVSRHKIQTPTSWKSGYNGSYYKEASCFGRKVERVPTSVPLKPVTNLRLNPWKVLDLVTLVKQRA